MNNELNVVSPADLKVGNKYFVKQLIPEDRYYGNEFAVEQNTTYIATVEYVSEATPSSRYIQYDWPWNIRLTDLKPFSPASNVTRKIYTTEGKLHNRIYRPPVFYEYKPHRISNAANTVLGHSSASTLNREVSDYLNGNSLRALETTSRRGAAQHGGTRKRKTGKKSKTGKKGKKSKTGKKGKKSKTGKKGKK